MCAVTDKGRTAFGQYLKALESYFPAAAANSEERKKK